MTKYILICMIFLGFSIPVFSNPKEKTLIQKSGKTMLDKAGFNLRISLRDIYSIKPNQITGRYQLRTPEGDILKGKLSREELKNILEPSDKNSLLQLKKDGFKIVVDDEDGGMTFTDPIEYARWAAKIDVSGVEAPAINEDGIVVFSEVKYPTNCRVNTERKAVRNCMKGRGGYKKLQKPYVKPAGEKAVALAEEDFANVRKRIAELDKDNAQLDKKSAEWRKVNAALKWQLEQ